MMTDSDLEDITKKYMRLSVREHGKGYIAPVLKPIDAIRYICDCLDSDFQFQGLSGFHLLMDGRIQPDQTLEIDFDESVTLDATLSRVGSMVFSKIGTDVVFEIAFSDRESPISG